MKAKVALVVGSVILSLFALETCARAYFPLHTVALDRSFRYDAELGVELAPGHHVAFGDFRHELRVNALGTVNYQERFDEYAKLVFAIGDSYTQGSGVAPDSAYPFQLDMMLNADGATYSNRVGIVNLGVAGYGTKQSTLRLKRYAEQLGAPGAVLFVGTPNDVVDDERFSAGARHRHYVSGNPDLGWRVAAVNVLRRLELVRRTRVAMAAPGTANGADDAAERQWPAIAELARACDELGATLVLSWAGTQGSYLWLRDKARAENIPFADWLPAAQRLHERIGVPLYNEHSGGHFRPWVYRLIAAAFAAEL